MNAIPDEITIEYIDSLIADGVGESRDLDYKLAPDWQDKKREFLADVSAFANAIGGLILYGVDEEREDGKQTGRPCAVVGIETPLTADQLRLQVEHIIRAGIEPRLPHDYAHAQVIEGYPDGRVVVAVRIRRSWLGPHMVAFPDRNTTQFYTRGSNGKYQLDYAQLRDAFAQSEDLSLRMRRFRDERLALLQAGESPAIVGNQPKVMLHLLPYTAFDSSTGVDITQAIVSVVKEKLRPMGGSLSYSRYNIDGYLCVAGDTGYVQVFREGIIEAVDSEIGASYYKTDDKRFLPAQLLAGKIIDACERYLAALASMGIVAPLAVGVSLVGFKGIRFATNGADWAYFQGCVVDRDMASTPLVVLHEYPDDVVAVLRPVLDAVWQAGGWKDCDLYKA